MKVEVEEPVEGTSRDTLLLGRSSWDAEAISLKYAWPDKNGRRARGGEMPIGAVPQAAVFAAREGYLTRDQIASLAKELVDTLADAH